MKWLSHLRTVQHHRFLVLRHCWRVGLYWQGLTHDLSKFSPVEFSAGAKYYQGNRSPNEIERREKGYSAAWLHHKGRNKHHLEYWIDYAADGSGMCGMKMPIQCNRDVLRPRSRQQDLSRCCLPRQRSV